MSVLERIAAETGIPLNRLMLIAQTADFRYKQYTIPKRSGGTRLIQHPARELKFLQHWIIDHVLTLSRVHDAATAYLKQSSVRRNAALHADNKYFLRIDFKDFFPSITLADVTNLLKNLTAEDRAVLTEEDIKIIGKIVTRNGRLTIGAPSSPIISNAIMYEFDDAMRQLARSHYSVYSRYADDLVFSTKSPHLLESLLPRIREYIASSESPSLQINEDKLAFNSKKRQVRVTGLIIDCQSQVSIGRAAKKKARALVHQFALGKLDPVQASYLKGYLGYVNAAEPKFMDALRRKYGNEIIDTIRHTPSIRFKSYDPLQLHQLFSAGSRITP